MQKPNVQKPEEKRNLVQRLNDAFMDEITTRPFPVERLSENWQFEANRALRFASPSSLGISVQEMERMVEAYEAGCNPGKIQEGKLSYFQFAILSNNLETRSAADLGLDFEDYLELMKEAVTHVEFYNEQREIIKKEVEQRIADMDANAKLKAGELTPVIGEA